MNSKKKKMEPPYGVDSQGRISYDIYAEEGTRYSKFGIAWQTIKDDKAKFLRVFYPMGQYCNDLKVEGMVGLERNDYNQIIKAHKELYEKPRDND